MAYTTPQIKTKFEILIDESYSGYFSNADLTNIGKKAVQNVITPKINDFQNTQKISEDLRPLLKTVTLTSASTPPISSNSVDLSNATLNYKSMISALVTYTGSTVQKRADPQMYAERGSYYSTGTTKYPKYRRANNLMYFEPSTPAITSIEFTYFKNPLVADFTDLDFAAATYTVAYSDEVVEEIVNEMIRLASETLRDNVEYAFAQANRQLDKTE